MTKFMLVAISFLTLPAMAASSKTSFKKNSTIPAISANSVAPSTTTVTMSNPISALANHEPKGLRVSVFKPVLNLHQKVRGQGEGDQSLDNTFGFSLGYANLPYKQVGYTTNAAYIEIFQAGEKIGLVRADANVGYGFEKNLNVKGGLNLSKFIIPNRIRDEYDPNIGVQASLGLAVTKNVGIDAGYTWMKHTNSNTELVLSGFEIGVNGTF